MAAIVGREPDSEWQDQLQASLRRAQDAIQQGVQQQDNMVRAWTQSMREAYPDWGRERWQRRLEKKLRKKAEHEARIANASLFEGYLWSLGALLLFIVALANTALWWLIFPAIGLGQRGVRVIARHANRGQEPARPFDLMDPARAGSQMSPAQSGSLLDPSRPGRLMDPAASVRHAAPASVDQQQRARRFGSIGQSLEQFGQSLREASPLASVVDGANTRGAYNGAVAPAAGAPPATDPRDARVDAICDKILAELRDAPGPVREIFSKPEQTVAALRDTCKNLTRRERDVRRFLSPEEDARLVREREALQKRIESEPDEVTRTRLASALAALEQQREQRAELSRSASRFEAEQTRISYTLESLYTQVVRMRSADAGSVDVAGAGLRRSLDLLSQEVNALADALEKVNAGSSEAEKLRAAGAQGPAAQVSSSPAPQQVQAGAGDPLQPGREKA